LSEAFASLRRWQASCFVRGRTTGKREDRHRAPDGVWHRDLKLEQRTRSSAYQVLADAFVRMRYVQVPNLELVVAQLRHRRDQARKRVLVFLGTHVNALGVAVAGPVSEQGVADFVFHAAEAQPLLHEVAEGMEVKAAVRQPYAVAVPAEPLAWRVRENLVRVAVAERRKKSLVASRGNLGRIGQEPALTQKSVSKAT